MKHDPFYGQILSRLDSRLDSEVFEACAVELVRLDGYAAVPVLGGNDAGMDGAIADAQGEPLPLVTTTGKDCIGNLTSNLNQYVDKGGKRRKVAFATSQALTPQKQRNLYQRAAELGFTIIQLYERSAFAARLYRNPVWCKELLQLTGIPSALSVIPLTRRLLLNSELIGREDALDWLQQVSGDRLLAGEPGSGKTSLLYQLTQTRAALFVVNKDMSSIANAIREQEPKQIIVDDAHIDPDILTSLKRLRREIAAEFDIIATCWIGDVRTIRDILNLADTHIYTLRRLSRDQMVDVIAAAGIRGVNRLVREIVTQAEGLPGLAVTLSLLCLQGSVERIQTADALSSTILDFYVKHVESDVQAILAAFALGGDAGMPKQVVGQELDISPLKLRRVLAELAPGGVIAEVDLDGETLNVRPSAFRNALIREIFFSGASALPVSILNNLLQQTPNQIDTALELIHVKARRGNVPDDLLKNYLNTLPTVSKVWIAYAWLGPVEAEWVLKHYRGAIANIGYPTLVNAPKQAISALISEAVGDNRLLHATPEHPLRILQDWIHEAYPESDQALERRRYLFDSAKLWLLDMNDAATGYKALLYALDPKFASHRADPGSGNTITTISAYLTVTELSELQILWYQALVLTKEISVPDWQPFIDVIRDWACPYRSNSEDARKVMRDFAKQMASSLVERTDGQVSVVYRLRRLFEPLSTNFSVNIDPEINILYPQERHLEDWPAEKSRWLSDVANLSVKWRYRSPETNIHRLAEIEIQMADIGVGYTRLIPAFAHILAQHTKEPLEYVNAILRTNLSADILFPFLKKAVNEAQIGWELAVETCFGDQRFHAVTTEIILMLVEPPVSLLERALQALSQFPRLGESLYLRNALPEELLSSLLRHPDVSVAQAAALAEWQCDPKGIVREWLRPAWERTIVDHCTDDYWLGEILKSERHLAFTWLESRIKSDEFEVYRFERAIAAAISGLEQSKRRCLLEIVPDRYGYNGIVAQLVADDLDLFSYLLTLKHLKKLHLAPIAGDIDIGWCGKVKLASGTGYTPDEIAARTMMPIGVVDIWTGKQSEQIKGWSDKFSALYDNDDSTIRAIGLAGRAICHERHQKAKEIEYREDVYGID